jgi:hypothetical protein
LTTEIYRAEAAALVARQVFIGFDFGFHLASHFVFGELPSDVATLDHRQHDQSDTRKSFHLHHSFLRELFVAE